MTMTDVKKGMTTHDCLHENLIQDHSLQIAKLEEKSKYKEQSIMEIKADLKELNQKMDRLDKNVGKLINKSDKSDSELEQRVKTIETTLDLYKDFFKELKDDEKSRTNMQYTMYGLIIAVLGLLANSLFHFI